MRSLGPITLVALGIVVAAAGCAVQSDPAPYTHGVYGSSPSSPMAEGDVIRVDAPQRVIVLSNGQMYQVPADSTVYVNGQPMAWATVQPGSRVAIVNGQLVELRDGRYYVVTQAGGVAPAPVVAAPVATAIRQTVYGTVTSVDRDAIRVRTDANTFDVKMRDPKAAGIRKGDTVQIDMTFGPVSPSALPRR